MAVRPALSTGAKAPGSASSRADGALHAEALILAAPAEFRGGRFRRARDTNAVTCEHDVRDQTVARCGYAAQPSTGIRSSGCLPRARPPYAADSTGGR